MRISTRAGLPRDDNGAVVGPIGTIAPDGTMYVVWNEGFNITLATSTDGGKGFAPSHPAFDVAAPYFGGAVSIPGVSRAMGFPQVGIDPKNGSLYVVWSDFRNGDVDVFISRSTDRGATWTVSTAPALESVAERASAVSANFTGPGNWNPSGVPGAADKATFSAAGTYTVTFNNSPNPLPNPVLNQDLFVSAGNATFTIGTTGITFVGGAGATGTANKGIAPWAIVANSTTGLGSSFATARCRRAVSSGLGARAAAGGARERSRL